MAVLTQNLYLRLWPLLSGSMPAAFPRLPVALGLGVGSLGGLRSPPCLCPTSNMAVLSCLNFEVHTVI